MVKVKPRDVLQKIEVDQMIGGAKSLRDRALVVMLYIFGFRISEIIQMQKDIDLQIYLDEEDVRVLKVKHKALKKRAKGGIIESRDLYLEMDNLIYKDIIQSYYNTLEPGSRMFPITRVRAWQILKQINKDCWCHLFRHTRATNLADEGLSVQELMQWFDWNSPNMAMKYIQKRPIRNMADRIK